MDLGRKPSLDPYPSATMLINYIGCIGLKEGAREKEGEVREEGGGEASASAALNPRA